MAEWLLLLAQTVAEKPPLDSFLASFAATPLTQAVAQQLLGSPHVAPRVLLLVLATLLVVCVLLLSLVPKVRLFTWGTIYFWVSRDKKLTKANDINLELDQPNIMRRKVVFIRHGESEWNNVFNKGTSLWERFGPTFPKRILTAIVREILMFFELDSVFMDSPLSDVGIHQAWDLLTFLAAQPEGCTAPGAASKPVAELDVVDLVAIMRGDAGESVVVSSILRRAISTGLIALSTRLMKTPPADKVMLMTCCQEISRNVDTLALAPKDTTPDAPASEASMPNMGDLLAHFYRTRLDKKFNKGNKTLNQTAIRRQEQFLQWLFEAQNGKDLVIIAGHSLWFREFFKSFLPKSISDDSKNALIAQTSRTNKMVNCGCVAFDIYKGGRTGSVFRIDPESVTVIHGGFEAKGKKKAKKD